MGGLFGKKAQSQTPTRLNGIAINQSLYGNAIPLLYGTSRLPMMLIDYVDFKATPQSQSAGGKGGGGGSTTSYTYSASVVGLLCEGPINDVAGVFSDSTQTTLAALNLTLFKGGANQAPWSYMTSKHPDHALPYDHMAHVDGANFDLGGQAGLPNLSFEVKGLALYNGVDAEPSQIIVDYCTDPNHGCGFPYLASLTGSNSYQDYCIAMDFLISPQETTQRQAQDFLKEVLMLTNSNCVFTAGVGLRIVPYGDQAVSGNGKTYTPNLTPQYRFGDADYIYEEGQQPVVEKPIPSNQTFNIWTVEYLNRANQYNIDTETFRDDQDIAINGERPADTVTLHEITRASVALTVATLLCLRSVYVRSTYTFKVRADFSRLEPMDYVAIDDSTSGIVDKLVRITETEDAIDSELGEVFTITAEEVLVGPASAPVYDTELAQGYAANYGADPGNVAAPYIFTAPPALTTGGYEEWIAVCGQTGLWGWADVYASLDNVTYDHVGVKSNPSRYGSLVNALPIASDPDTVNQLTIVFSGSVPIELDSATRASADGLRNLCLVDGEVISYQNVVPMGNNTFRLSYLRRGNYGSTIAAHAVGSSFAILDSSIFRMPFDPGLSGQPVWFKFVSANYYGGGVQDISKVTAYQAFFQGQNNGQLLAPGATPLIARGSCVNVGSQIFKKSTGLLAFDSDCYSLDAFSGGCLLRFRPMQANGQVDYFVGLNSDPLTDEIYTSLDFAWHIGNGAEVWQGGNLVLPTGPFDTNTIFEIRYDSKYVTFYRSGVQWWQTAAPNKVFFLDSSFATPGASIDNVYFGALNPANSSPFIARGQCKVSDENIQKSGGNNGWDSDAYSLEGYPVCHVSFKANDNINGVFAAGLGARPAQDVTQNSIDFAWFCAGASPSAGRLQILEGGAVALDLGVGQYDSTTVLAITYDGTTVSYLLNGVVKRTVTVPGLLLFFDSSLWTGSGGGLNSLQFGPTTNLKLTDTTQIGQNAASSVASAQSATTVGVSMNSSAGFTRSVDIISATVTTTGNPVAIDTASNVVATAAHQCVINPFNISVYRDGTQIASSIWDPTNAGANPVTENYSVNGQLITLSVTDTPTAGTHTYTMHVNATTGGIGVVVGIINCTNNFIKVREYKR